MSREKQTKKVSKERQEYLKFKPFADDLRKAESWCELDGVLNRYQTVKNLSKMGYRKQSEVELRVETTTDDFRDLEIAKERGYHRKKFYCPNCDLLIKIETWDSERMFGGGTILKSNEMPSFCPNCGAKMKGGEK